MNAKLSHWRIGDYLKSVDDQILYLIASMEEAGDDRNFLKKAIQDIAIANQHSLDGMQLNDLVEKLLEITSTEKILTQENAAYFIQSISPPS